MLALALLLWQVWSPGLRWVAEASAWAGPLAQVVLSASAWRQDALAQVLALTWLSSLVELLVALAWLVAACVLVAALAALLSLFCSLRRLWSGLPWQDQQAHVAPAHSFVFNGIDLSSL